MPSTPSASDVTGAAGGAMGANQAFLLDGDDRLWTVEQGYVDIFAVLIDAESRRQVRRRPFMTRVSAGGVFTGGPAVPSARHANGRLSLLAVPSRDAALSSRPRLEAASSERFDIHSVTQIDEWVSAVADFVARHVESRSHRVNLLEAEPNVAYEQGATVSAHHLDVLWVSADRLLHFMGHADLTLEAENLLPLTEQTWFTLPESARISALRTPGALRTGSLWASMDSYVALLLRFSEHHWSEHLASGKRRIVAQRRTASEVRGAMYRTLAEVLNERAGEPVRAQPHRETPLQRAAALVAEAAGARLRMTQPPARAAELSESVSMMVQSSRIRVRHIRLEPGWQTRDGPSFLGLSRGESQRPLAVINGGFGAYRCVDPETGTVEPVGPRQAERIGAWGMMFYAPLAEGVTTGLAALREAVRGLGRDIGTVATMGVLAGLLALLVPVVTGKLLGEIIPRVDTALWVAAVGALALGGLGTAAVTVVSALSMVRIESRIDERLQSAVWNRLVSLPLPFFRKYVAGDLADRANGVSQIRRVLTGATAASVVTGVFSVFSFGLLFWYNARLALWAGALMLVLAAATWFCAIRQIRHHRAAFRAQGAIDGLVVQMISGLAKLRQANAEVHMLAQWSAKYREQKRATLMARYWAAGQLAFNTLFTPLAMMAILALIWYRLISVENPVDFSLADFLSFNSAFGQFVAGVTGLTTAWTAVVAVVPLFERVQPILEAAPESTGALLADFRGRLEFDEVTFRYSADSHDALRKVTFNIQPGERVAFVGPSGAGKSTVLRLVLGYERPASGAVLVDGHDLQTLDLASVRSQMGVVMQQVDLVPGSILKNIAGSVPVTLEEAWEAARKTGLDRDIRSMPMGMHTVLPEAGQGLSGGQKQRLLLTRVLARSPRVLLLDEATSMLDNTGQSLILESLRQLNATQVIVAHRLSTVRDMDRIYVLKDGRIAEVGSYDHLMSLDGVFAELARRQMA